MKNTCKNTTLQQRVPKQNDRLTLQHIQYYQNFIDEMLQLEMERIKRCYLREEEHFMQKMLHLNPVTVKQRASERYGSNFNEQAAANRQAEVCRKSRLKNKIKKAKVKYRHSYVTHKLTQNINIYHCISSMIAQTEAQLLLSGSYTQPNLLSLRNSIGFRS